MDNADVLMAEAYDEGVVSEVIRPAAIVPEEAARAILVELALNDVRGGGVWESEPQLWSLHAPAEPGQSSGELIGTIQVAYGTPTKYEMTIYRVTMTRFGTMAGFTVNSLTDTALTYGGLTLAQCPRATLMAPPKPFAF